MRQFCLIILLGLISFQAIGQITLNISGKVIDFKTKESITGVAIKCYQLDKLINTEFSKEDGAFQVELKNDADRLELYFIGYLPLIIENINNCPYDIVVQSEIQLYPDPFELIDCESKPSRKERKERRLEQKEVQKGLDIVCENGNKYKMSFSKKDFRLALYINFQDLMNCVNEKNL